jgi:type I restriction enzyme, S subunit
MSRIIQVKNVAELNLSTYRKDEFPQIIKYLDTSSLTKNKIENFQILDSNLDKIPSRAQRKIKLNTILFSTVRPNQEHYGIIEKELENTVVSTGFTTIDVIDNKINPKYLFYLLTQPHITNYLHTIATNSVSAYPSISSKDLGNLKFTIPELSTQQKIASALSVIDEKIELNNQINAELEKMAKTIYDYWFVQFDFPDENGKPYKSSGGKMVWNEQLKREIPDGWKDESLWKIAKYYNGLAMQKHRPSSSNYLPVIKIKEMGEGFSEKTEKARVDIPSEAVVNNGDVLFSWSATLDVKIWSGGKGALNQHIFKVTSNKYPKTFYYFELRNYLEHFKMMADNRKTTMGHITQDHLKQSRISIPPVQTIEKLDSILEPILTKQIVLHQENQQLIQLRDWLLPMLMNSQVKVE